MTTTAAPPITVRVLPPEEFDRLADLPFATNGIPDPSLTVVLVAETPDQTIVGLWAVMTAVHLDGLWIAPAYRKTPHLGGKLLRGMKALLAQLGIPRAVTLVQTSDVLVLALKAGFTRVPGDSHAARPDGPPRRGGGRRLAMPVVPFIPLIAQGVGLVGGAIAGKKAQKAAQQRSPEEQVGLQGAQQAAGALGTTGQSMLSEGRPWVQQPANYFQSLLSGDRAKMSQAIAAPTAQITQQARGEERGLERSGVRGAARDVAAADIGRRRGSAISGLTTGVQPAAANSLAGLGQQHLATGGQFAGEAGNIYGSLLGQGFTNRKYAREEGGKTGAAIGNLVASAGNVLGGVLSKRAAGDDYEPPEIGVSSGLPSGVGQQMPMPFQSPFPSQRPWENFRFPNT